MMKHNTGNHKYKVIGVLILVGALAIGVAVGSAFALSNSPDDNASASEAYTN